MVTVIIERLKLRILVQIAKLSHALSYGVFKQTCGVIQLLIDILEISGLVSTYNCYGSLLGSVDSARGNDGFTSFGQLSANCVPFTFTSVLYHLFLLNLFCRCSAVADERRTPSFACSSSLDFRRFSHGGTHLSMRSHSCKVEQA